jgi:protein-S-isoprenylcysteine O-methyltransferase
MSVAVPGVLIAMFVGHVWLALKFRSSLDAAGGDRVHDRLFHTPRFFVAFTSLCGWQALGIYRRIAIELERWNGQGWLSAMDVASFPALTPVLIAGAIVYALGLALRLWSIRTLRQFFTYQIGIRPGHQLVTHGPYRWIRHPSYSGYLLVLTGIGIACSSGLVLIVTLLPMVAFFALRIPAEERMLSAHFGSAYEEFRRNTKRLVPFLL